MYHLSPIPAAFALAAAFAAAPAAGSTFATLSGAAPIMIAHRGASGYLPEHTLAAYELGAKLGADYIEPDLVITADGVAVALHDLSLARTTNVEDLFAPRNGGFNASEFTLAEIKTLTVEPVGTSSTTFPGFTPSSPDPFRVPTFREVLDFVNAFNAAEGTEIGVYPEVKAPSAALNRIVVEELIGAGFGAPGARAYIQSFDFDALRAIALIQSELGSDIDQIALGFALEVSGELGLVLPPFVPPFAVLPLSDIAAFADGVGVSTASPALGAPFIALAHDLGLEVHAFTFNLADPDLAAEELLPLFAIGLDGFFTNFPDSGVAAVARASAVTAVPLPASGLLMAGAVAFAAFLRRRRAA